jgi:ELWxxDGT repeat protein
MKRITIAVLSLAASVGTQQIPGTPRLVADFNTTTPVESSTPDQYTPVGSLTYFVASTESSGRELYRSFGSRGSTAIVRDIAHGIASSNPVELTAVGSRLFFFADDHVHGLELHVSDGTESGTRMIADLEPGGAGSLLRAGFAVNGRFVFARGTQATGLELWVSDGTAANTNLLFDIHPGAASAFSTHDSIAGCVVRGESSVERLVVVASTANGLELWSSDGTTSGTVSLFAVRQSFTRLSSWSAGKLPDGRGVLALDLLNPSVGMSWSTVFVSDGRAAGTHFLFDDGLIQVRPPGERMRRFGDRLALVRRDTLWLLDGDPLGSVGISLDPSWSSVQVLHEVGGSLHAVARVGNSDRATLLRLAAGSNVLVVVGELTVPFRAGINDPRRGTVVVGGNILTTGFGTVPSLWIIDPNRAESEHLAISSQDGPVAGSGTVFVSLMDPQVGLEPGTSDGTIGGTRVLADLATPQNGQQTQSSQTSRYYPVGDRALFVLGSSRSVSLFLSDGTPSGTTELAAGFLTSSLTDAIESDGTIWMTIASRLWTTDGTPAGTREVSATDPLHVLSNLVPLADGVALVARRSNVFGVYRVRRSRVDLVGSMEAVTSPSLARLGERLIVLNTSTTNGMRQVRALDPRTGAFQVLVTVPAAPGQFDVVAARDRIWFPSSGGSGVMTLWSTDGTAAGTVNEFQFGDGSVLEDLAVGGDTIWFASAARITALDLNSRAVRAIPRSGSSVLSRDIVPLGDRLIYTQSVSPTRMELMSTDGTAVGTSLLASAPFSGSVQAAGGRFALAVGLGTSGSPILLVTDGTVVGTRELASTAPSLGPFLSTTPERALVQGQVFLTLFDPRFGSEPHVIDVGAAFESSVAACGGDGRAASLSLDGALELGARREFRVRSSAGSVGFLLLGLDPGRSIPFAAAGVCQLAVDPSIALVSAPLALAQGEARWVLDVPDLALLDGILMSAQAVIGGTDAALGFDLSNGLALSLGR